MKELEGLFVSTEEAIYEIKKRQLNLGLVSKVTTYLQGDIPDYFTNGPSFYLSRHVASPNFESLRFIELCHQHHKDIPMIIGQDTHDKFVSNNSMKRALGKMPIIKGVSHNLDEIVEFVTIVDFDHSQGMKLGNIQTLGGKSLTVFHNELFNVICSSKIHIVDESSWIDRNYRGDLRTHYKRLLALLLTKGILFETYEDRDMEFVETILIPAIQHIEEEFGCRPLIVNLIPSELMHLHNNWDGYPSVLYKIVKDHIAPTA